MTSPLQQSQLRVLTTSAGMAATTPSLRRPGQPVRLTSNGTNVAHSHSPTGAHSGPMSPTTAPTAQLQQLHSPQQQQQPQPARSPVQADGEHPTAALRPASARSPSVQSALSARGPNPEGMCRSSTRPRSPLLQTRERTRLKIETAQSATAAGEPITLRPRRSTGCLGALTSGTSSQSSIAGSADIPVSGFSKDNSLRRLAANQRRARSSSGEKERPASAAVRLGLGPVRGSRTYRSPNRIGQVQQQHHQLAEQQQTAPLPQRHHTLAPSPHPPPVPVQTQQPQHHQHVLQQPTQLTASIPSLTASIPSLHHAGTCSAGSSQQPSRVGSPAPRRNAEAAANNMLQSSPHITDWKVANIGSPATLNDTLLSESLLVPSPPPPPLRLVQSPPTGVQEALSSPHGSRGESPSTVLGVPSEAGSPPLDLQNSGLDQHGTIPAEQLTDVQQDLTSAAAKEMVARRGPPFSLRRELVSPLLDSAGGAHVEGGVLPQPPQQQSPLSQPQHLGQQPTPAKQAQQQAQQSAPQRSQPDQHAQTQQVFGPDQRSRSASSLQRPATAEPANIQLEHMGSMSSPTSPSEKSATPISIQLDMSPLQPTDQQGGLAWSQPPETLPETLRGNSSRDTLTLTSTAPSSLVASAVPSRRESLRGRGEDGASTPPRDRGACGDSTGSLHGAASSEARGGVGGSKFAAMRSLWEERAKSRDASSGSSGNPTAGGQVTRYRLTSSCNRCSSDDVHRRLRRLRQHEERNSRLTNRLMNRLHEISSKHHLDLDSPSGSSATSAVSELSPVVEGLDDSPNTQLCRGLDRSLTNQFSELRRVTKAALRVVSLEHIFRSGNGTCDVAVSTATEGVANLRCFNAVDAVAAAAAAAAAAAQQAAADHRTKVAGFVRDGSLHEDLNANTAPRSTASGDLPADDGAQPLSEIVCRPTSPPNQASPHGAEAPSRQPKQQVPALVNITNQPAWLRPHKDEEIKKASSDTQEASNAPPPTLKARRRSDEDSLRAALAVDGTGDISEILSASWSTIAATSTTATPRLDSELEDSAESSCATPRQSIRVSWQAPAIPSGETPDVGDSKRIATASAESASGASPQEAAPVSPPSLCRDAEVAGTPERAASPIEDPSAGTTAAASTEAGALVQQQPHESCELAGAGGACAMLPLSSASSPRSPGIVSVASSDSSAESSDCQELLVPQGAHGMDHTSTKLYEFEQAELIKHVEFIVPTGMGPERKIIVKFEGQDYDVVLPEGCQAGEKMRIPLYRKPPLEANQAQAQVRGHAFWEDRATIFNRLMQRTNVQRNECILEDPSSWNRAACRVDDRESRSRQIMYAKLRGQNFHPMLPQVEEQEERRRDCDSDEECLGRGGTEEPFSNAPECTA